MIEWRRCPVCGNKTRLQIRTDTELRSFPLYCQKCKQESLIDAIEEKSERKVHTLTCGQHYADCIEIKAMVLERFPPKPAAIEFMKEYDKINADEVFSKKHSPKTRK